MKRLLKTGLITLIVSVISLGAVLQGFAESIYIVNGYSYTYIDNTSISLCGWDGRTSELVVPDSIAGKYVTEISARGFQSSENFSQIDFSQAKHLETIRTYAFENCAGLTGELRLEGSFSSVEDCAFQNCKLLDSLFVGNNISAIPSQCFSGCDSLKNVELADGINKINAFAFSSCDSLENVVIPASVTNISMYAFSGSENFVINCYTDSYAQSYAVENSIPYILLDGPKIGDVNGDGVVDILDATEIQKYAAESTDFTPEQFELGDINKDGYCDVIDALLVQKSVIGAYELPQNIIRY